MDQNNTPETEQKDTKATKGNGLNPGTVAGIVAICAALLLLFS